MLPKLHQNGEVFANPPKLHPKLHHASLVDDSKKAKHNGFLQIYSTDVSACTYN